jgi:cell wall-associated NlpC family hydrolase
VDGSISASCGCTGSASPSSAPAAKPHEPNSELAQKAVDKAVSLLGTPYVSGGSDSQGTDCSGLVQQAVPDYFPRRMTATEQLNYLKSQDDEDVPANELKPGDLVYFQDNQGEVSHAAVVEKANLSGERPTGIIAASSSKNHQYVVRQKLDPRGSLGGNLRYAGGGRPR